MNPRKNKPDRETPPETEVLRFIQHHAMILPGSRLLVAVSGGADSICLLYILAALRRELDIELHVAHLDHRLRGQAGEADARYVAGAARRLGIPASIGYRDTEASRAAHRLTLEEAAREVRYTFLGEVAAEIGAERVAVGHTADDNVETVLMHLLRGSGTRGLRGLQPVTRLRSPSGDLTVVRPLLETTREETVAYCRRHHLSPRLDATNLSPGPFRNRIRRELLPLLRRYNPQVDLALLRTARIARDDLDFIERQAEHYIDTVTRFEKDSVIYDKTSFSTLAPALQRHLLRAGIESVLGSLKDIEAGHIEDIIDALDKSAGRVIGLRAGLNLTIEYDRYVLACDALASCPLPALGGETPLRVPGETNLKGWRVQASVLPYSEVGEKVDEEVMVAIFDREKAGENLTVRRRRPGDRFQPLGMGETKKVGEFMIDARIPRSWRGRVPIVAAGDKIIWVVGWRIDDRFKITAVTREVLRLEFSRT